MPVAWEEYIITYLHNKLIIQVHLQKLEYREKVFFFVTWFKKWNFHIF